MRLLPLQQLLHRRGCHPLASGKYTGTADDLAKHDTLDICYDVNRTLNGALTATDFTMKHAMAMVQLSFERLNYDSDNCNLTSVSIKNKELISTATLNIGTGAYTTVTNAALTWTPAPPTPPPAYKYPPRESARRPPPCWYPARSMPKALPSASP
ncbi:fimbrillin family protein [Bacteroides sp. CR5/BHMF/2]|nr:fimbrillin family protein [Bacteroides sp. CR5/BHMF/2]